MPSGSVACITSVTLMIAPRLGTVEFAGIEKGSEGLVDKAAEQGQYEAQSNLGSLHYQGKGVPQDYVEAAKWFRKAAEQGFAKAQAFLGAMYFEGNGVRRIMYSPTCGSTLPQRREISVHLRPETN